MTTRLWMMGFSAAVAVALSSFSALAQGNKKAPAVDWSKLPATAEKKDITYQADIKPLLDESCIKCHGADRPKARLRLDSLEGVLKGGERGKVVTPSDIKKSILMSCVAQLGDPDLFMPPPNNKAKIAPLTKAQVGLIRGWIEQGAK